MKNNIYIYIKIDSVANSGQITKKKKIAYTSQIKNNLNMTPFYIRMDGFAPELLHCVLLCIDLPLQDIYYYPFLKSNLSPF